MKAADRFDSLIKFHTNATVLPWELVKAQMIQESSANPRAVSPAGAKGLMQFMGPAAQDMGLTEFWNPEESIRAGVGYLLRQWNRLRDVPFTSDRLKMALASYNCGLGYILKAGKLCKEKSWELNWDNVSELLPGAAVRGRTPDVAQVRHYVNKIWENYQERL